MKKLLKQIMTAGLASLLFLVVVPSAYAAFPGQNGKLAYGFLNLDFENETFSTGIADMNIDGTDSRNLATTSWAGNFDTTTRAPRYSADGLRITYTHESGRYDLDIYTMNADGTDKRNVTNLDFEDNNRFAMYSSFHPDGNQLTYGELWYEDSEWYGEIFITNQDGTGKQQLTTTDSDYCNVYPVFSPDGSSIAFYRGNRVSGVGGIYTMNADGTNQQQIIQTVSSDGCHFHSIGVGALVVDSGFVSNFDWSPDGGQLVYVHTDFDGENHEGTTSLRVVDLEGEYQVVREETTNVAAQLSLGSAQFTPSGQIIYKEMTIVEDEGAEEGFVAASSTNLIDADGSNAQTITTTSGEGGQGLYVAIGAFMLPTVQPVHNTITISSASNAPIHIATPTGTKITCSNVLTEPSQPTQDPTHTYPLGLVDFCFDTTEQNNTVTLTFVTNLKPNEVIARKYNTTTNTYFTIEDATITQATYNSQPALRLTYTIADNGILDLDPETGKVRDPVGLAVAEGSGGGELASTGVNQGLILLATFATISGAGWLLIRQMRNSSQI